MKIYFTIKSTLAYKWREIDSQMWEINKQLDCIIEEESSKFNDDSNIKEESNYNYISENNYEYVNMDYKNIENNTNIIQ